MEDKIFFKPGDIVSLRHDIPNKPEMVVVGKAISYLRDKLDYFKGIKCRWFNSNQELQEAIFNTKDLQLIKSE